MNDTDPQPTFAHLIRSHNMIYVERLMSRLWKETREYKKGGDTENLDAALGCAQSIQRLLEKEIDRHAATK